MSSETQPIRVPTRRENEGSLSYRRRISKLIPKREGKRPSKISKDEAFHSWIDQGSDLTIEAYFGWAAETGELKNDRQGMNVEHGSSAPEAAFGDESLKQAYNLTKGKPITSQDFVGLCGRVLTQFEQVRGVRLPYKREFLKSVKVKVIELRGLRKKGEELLRTH